MSDRAKLKTDVTVQTASVLADIAYAAGHSTDEHAGQYVLEKLQPLLHFDAAAIFSMDSRYGTYQVLGSAGYAKETLDGLQKNYTADIVHNHLINVRSPVRIDSLPYDWRASKLYSEVISPAGFKDGVGCCLFTADGVHSGMIQMNAGPLFERHVPELLSIVARSLGRMTDQREQKFETFATSYDPQLRASCIDAYGLSWQVPDADEVTVRHLPGFIEFARRFLSSSSLEARGLWPSAEGWLEVRVEKIRHPRSRIHAALLVTERTADLECELTNRELDVLQKIAQGFSNQRIASDLSIAHRTVTTHVERVLRKLGQESRAGAVSKAYREGLFPLDQIPLKKASEKASPGFSV